MHVLLMSHGRRKDKSVSSLLTKFASIFQPYKWVVMIEIVLYFAVCKKTQHRESIRFILL